MLKRIKNQSVGDTIFDIVVALFLLLAVVVCVYPFLYVISVSISSGEAVNKGLVTLLPVDLNFEALKSVLNYDQLWVSYGNTIFYTVAGTFFNIIFTCLAAYPLSRKTFCFRKQMNFLLAFTMYFSGGLIPIYIVVTNLGLYNSRWAMILPVLVSAYNVMICRSAFEAISEELFEEARLEGANDILIMTRIAIPLIIESLPVTSGQREIIREIISLPAKWKTVLLLHYIEGYSIKETAKITGLTESNVKKRLQRGRDALKKQLTECEGLYEQYQ